MRVLFEQRIGPTLERIDQIAAGRMTQFSQMASEMEAGLAGLIAQAAEVAEKSSSHIVENIKTEIIKETTNSMLHLIDKVNHDVLNIIDTVDCAVDGQEAKLQIWVKSQIHFWPNPFNSCYREYALASTPDSDDLFSIYKIKRCEYLKDLSASPTVESVMDN